MRSNSFTASLRSYLDAGLDTGEAKFRLEITQIPRQVAHFDGEAPPFLRVGNSGPTACLTSAKITTDVGALVRDVFLLKQEDEYRLYDDEIWPLNNIDIDRRWQRVVARHSNGTVKRSWGHGPLLLKDQIDGSGKLLRFQSLFYCIFRDVYFHPPCPQCGYDLQLCEDDQLLIKSELKAYSTSLNRYLYCTECIQHGGQTPFYAFIRETSDPPHLKDRGQLISDFGQLVLNTTDADHFPCTSCKEKSKCYGPNNLVGKRIVPFGFYPFYGLVCEAPTLHAVDFLMLLSGATPDELRRRLLHRRELGRLTLLDAFCSQDAGPPSCLFAPDHPRRFLEILYLKLSFLGELVDLVSAETGAPAGFDIPFSIDDVWITLPDHSHRLPSFWNFKLSIMDFGRHADSSDRLSKYPPAYSHHLLGIIWFYVLLANRRQSIEKVRAEVEEMLAVMTGAGHNSSRAGQTSNCPVLAPENIYWNPGAKTIDDGCRQFWEKAMDLGGEMLAASIERKFEWPENRFWPAFESLRKEITDEMLGRPALHAPQQPDANDSAIAAILLKLQGKWSAEQKTAADARDLDETLALAASDNAAVESDRLAYKQEKCPPTVVIAPEKAAESRHPRKPAANEEETLLLTPESYPASKKAGVGLKDEGIVEETIVLSSKDLLNFTATAGPDLPYSDEKDPGTTIVVSPGRNSKRKQTSGPESEDDEADFHPENGDVLTATVVLQPKKKK